MVRRAKHRNVPVVHKSLVNVDASFQIQGCDGIAVGLPWAVAFACNHCNVMFWKLGHGLQQNVKSLVRSKVKKQMHHAVLVDAGCRRFLLRSARL